MPQEEAKKAKTRHWPEPEIADLGSWPKAEEQIRERALAQGMPLEEIESLLAEIREARKTMRQAEACRRVTGLP